MTTPWRTSLETLLRSGMKYCFPTITGKYPQIDELQFAGEAEQGIRGSNFFKAGEPGFLDAVISFVLCEKQQAFKAGYLLGAKDCFADLKSMDCLTAPAFSEEDNIRGGDRQWQVWDKENP